MKTRTFTSSLVGRDEVFNMLALSESLRLPVLLIGDRGTAKTQAALDYIDGAANAYMIQLSQGTRAQEIKGTVDMEEYITNKKFVTISPISTAKAIIIDEVDKAFGGVRDMLLSIMRERKLFLGSEGTKECAWEVFVGCCNEIPASEKRSPFWDRFILKYEVTRLGQDLIPKIWNAPNAQHVRNIYNGEIGDGVQFNSRPVDVLTKALYKQQSDRTIYQLPRIIKAISLIWSIGIEEATIKAASLIQPDAVAEVSANIYPKDVAEIKVAISNIPKVTSLDQLNLLCTDLVGKIRNSKNLSTEEKHAFGIVLNDEYNQKQQSLIKEMTNVTIPQVETETTIPIPGEQLGVSSAQTPGT